jgi:hypothetical protein
MSNVSGEKAGRSTRGKGKGGQGKFAALGKSRRDSDDDDDDDDDDDFDGDGGDAAWVLPKPAAGQGIVPKPAPQRPLSKKLKAMPLFSSQGQQSTLTVNIRNLQEKQDGSGLGASQKIKHTLQLSVPSSLAAATSSSDPQMTVPAGPFFRLLYEKAAADAAADLVKLIAAPHIAPSIIDRQGMHSFWPTRLLACNLASAGNPLVCAGGYLLLAPSPPSPDLVEYFFLVEFSLRRGPNKLLNLTFLLQPHPSPPPPPRIPIPPLHAMAHARSAALTG